MSSVSKAGSKPRWTRELLQQTLSDLQAIGILLPPTLPPSPPASRESSPAPSAKRKLADQSHVDQQHYKRPRTSSSTRSALRPRLDHTTEDGEVLEDVSRPVNITPSVFSSSLPDSTVPVRRPKSTRPDMQTFQKSYDKWYQAGRLLKYSGDVRFRSTYPPNHNAYTPLLDPPPTNSPYHKYGSTIAQLESIDALISFTYALWCKDMATASCNDETWKTMEAFLDWCKAKWNPEKNGTQNEADRAFYGLIWMIEAFIKARLLYNHARSISEHTLRDLNASLTSAIAQAVEAAEQGSSFPDRADTKCSTPKMLPSPANSVAATRSANSTPTSHDSGTPDPSHPATSAGANSTTNASKSHPSSLPVPLKIIPQKYQDMLANGKAIPDSIRDAMGAAKGSISSSAVQKLSEHTHDVMDARRVVNQSQTYLTLPIMARSFPRTFARMVHSTLDVNEEWAPDFEDEEGELFWPGQATNGEGLGWVCLMGKAMIQEFGEPYGYRGLRGVIPKRRLSTKATPAPVPRPSLPSSSGRSPLPPSQLPASASR